MKKMIPLLCLAWCVITAQAQQDETENITVNSAQEMADYLRSEYGVAKSVYLTQIAQQLSQSFASTEQLQQQWQQALETEIIEPMSFTQINSHSLAAQALIQFTNGMTLNRWRQIDLPLTADFPQLNDPYITSDTFASWLNLTSFWQMILNNDTQKNMAEWLDILAPSYLNEIKNSTNKEQHQSLSIVLSELSKQPEMSSILLHEIDNSLERIDVLSTALLRQYQHLQDQQLLPLAYDWIEIYQLIELNPNLLTAQEQTQLSKLIETTQIFWTQSQELVNNIDDQLYSLILDVLKELPIKFKDPDHFNENLNQQLFSLLTGVENPSTYFNHPLRKEIQENLEVCLNLSVKQTPEPPVPIAVNQFDSCLTEFMQWGISAAKSGDLAGNLIKLDNTSSINRALDLPSVQIINNLSMQAAAEIGCQQQLNARSNMVEWLMAAETVAWFHDRWPGLMADRSQSEQLNQLIQTGRNLNNYPECVNNIHPLAAQFSLLKSKWEHLKQEIVTQVNEYTDAELSTNSDVDLFKSIEQQTNYIPDNFVIKACDVKQSCGAFATLEPSNEILNLFPNHLKLAQQFGLGELEICYDQLQWQNRKAVATHLDNNKIANFEGQLSIQLNGRFQNKTVFTKSLMSEQSHVYLFGENNQETLDLDCPLPIIGKQINTTLDRGTFGLLPNRLTFLTASKIDINAVIRSNWLQWQSQINTDSNQFSYFDEMTEFKTVLNDAFLQHVNELQQQIYRKLIANNLSRANDSALSNAAFEFLTHRKLLAHMTMGLYPQLYASDANIHAALSGNDRLVDMTYFRNAFQNQLNVMDMMLMGDANFSQYDSLWETVNHSEQWVHSTIKQLKQIQSFASHSNNQDDVD